MKRRIILKKKRVVTEESPEKNLVSPRFLVPIVKRSLNMPSTASISTVGRDEDSFKLGKDHISYLMGHTITQPGSSRNRVHSSLR
jgi:hypothetical protein